MIFMVWLMLAVFSAVAGLVGFTVSELGFIVSLFVHVQ